MVTSWGCKPVWKIDKSRNVLFLSGFVVDTVKYVECYNEKIFGNATIHSKEGRNDLQQVWQRIITCIEKYHIQTPFSTTVLSAVATSFSYGLDKKSDPADEGHLLH
jgi:hypothetical protein